MVRAPTLDHVVARAPTFCAVSIQKVVVGEIASAHHSSEFGGEYRDPLYILSRSSDLT